MSGKNDGGKNKKYGRNKKDAARYTLEKRLEKNKAKRLVRHNVKNKKPANYMGGYTAPGGPAHPKASPSLGG